MKFRADCEYCGKDYGEMKNHCIELSLHIRDKHENQDRMGKKIKQ